MNILKRIWIRIVRLLKTLEGMDDPIGDYIFAVGRRVEQLERDLGHLKKQRNVSKP